MDDNKDVEIPTIHAVDWDLFNAEADSYQDEGEIPPSLLGSLSPELILEILQHLPWYEMLPVAATCRLFRDLCYSGAIWSRMKFLDFTSCGVPLAEKIEKIVKSCPNAESMLVGAVILAEEEMEVDEPSDGDTSSYDNFVDRLLQGCPSLTSLDVDNPQTTDNIVDSLISYCPRLWRVHLSQSRFIKNNGIVKLVSSLDDLKVLHISRCSHVINLDLKHPEGIPLQLTSIMLEQCFLVADNISTLAQNCPQLEYLHISDAMGLDAIKSQVVDGSLFHCLKKLVLNSCLYLLEVELSGAPVLQEVDLRQCHLLQKVKLDCAKLTSLLLDGCYDVHSIALYSDKLQGLDLTNSVQLQMINIRSPCLKVLNLTNCECLPVEQLVNIEGLEGVESLMVDGCRYMSTNEIQKYIAQMPKIRELKCGGHPCATATLNCKSLKKFHFKNVLHTPSLLLELPELQSLCVESCRDIVEDAFLEGLLYGRKVKKKDSIFTSEYEPGPELFSKKLKELKLLHLPGIHGESFSSHGQYFEKLSHLEIVKCGFIKNLRLTGWPSLESVSISSCSSLKTFHLIKSSRVKSVQINWCNCIDGLVIKAAELHKVDFNGTHFSFNEFVLHSDHLESLQVAGLGNFPEAHVDVRCPALKSLSFHKCLYLNSDMLHNILSSCTNVLALHMSNCIKITELLIPDQLETLKLTGLKRLNRLLLPVECRLKEIAFNGLPKLSVEEEDVVFTRVRHNLSSVEMWTMATRRKLSFPHLEALSIDQGVHLQNLEVECPSLKYLRIKACPKLSDLRLMVSNLGNLEVQHSMPCLALHTLHLFTSSLRGVPDVLAQYSPNLQVLILTVSVYKVTMRHVCLLGCQLTKLHTVILDQCDCLDEELEQYSPHPFTLAPQTLGKYTRGLLVKFDPN